jgi:hypothetical protein
VLLLLLLLRGRLLRLIDIHGCNILLLLLQLLG